MAMHAGNARLRSPVLRFDLLCADSSNWSGSGIDLVLCNPYAPLPRCLWGLPSIISLYEAKESRREKTQGWIGGTELKLISKWGRGNGNAVYVANLPAVKMDLSDMLEDFDQAPKGEGWFPLDLPLRLLGRYARAGMTIWDGFMGRGTTGKAAKMLGMGFVGIDKEPWRVDYAKEYIGC